MRFAPGKMKRLEELSSKSLSRLQRYVMCVCVWGGGVRCGCVVCEPIKLNPQLQCMSINVPLFPWLQQCHEHKNFNTTTSIVSGLSLAAVRRLKRSWEVCGIMYILLALVENIFSRLEKSTQSFTMTSVAVNKYVV